MSLRLNGQDMTDEEVANYRAGNIAGTPASTGYAFTDSGLAYLYGNLDSKVNALNQEALWNREDVLRKAAEAREDTSIDRLVKAAERNGINPIFLLDAINGNTGQAASYSTSASKTSNYESNERTDAANSAKIAGALIAAIGMIIAHTL